MNWLHDYAVRLISGAMLCSVLLALPLRHSVKNVLTVACGCFLIVLTVSPLFQVDLDSYTARLPQMFESQTEVAAGENEKLLQDLICSQTEDVIEQKATEYEISCKAAVSLRYDTQIGSYLPDAVTVTVESSKGSLSSLQQFITDELAIPEERQKWILK